MYVVMENDVSANSTVILSSSIIERPLVLCTEYYKESSSGNTAGSVLLTTWEYRKECHGFGTTSPHVT